MDKVNGFYSFVRRLGQWHLFKSNESTSLCGMPMLSNNYSDVIPIQYRTKCMACFNEMKSIEKGD